MEKLAIHTGMLAIDIDTLAIDMVVGDKIRNKT